jgi:acetyl esterase/lipase
VPLVVSDLLHIPLPRVDQTRHVYHEVDGCQLTLDLYRSSPPGRCPATVIVVHGGAWSSGDNTQLRGLNRYLAGRGYAVAAINYRLAPKHRFPAALEDVMTSIEFMTQRAVRFGTDPNRIVLLGRSSGGHLALLAGYRSSLPSIRGVVALYPPTDMRWSWDRPAPRRLMDSNGAIVNFLGGSPSEVPDAFDRASPIDFVSPNSPPTLLLHGGSDELVSPLQSHRLSERLLADGVPSLHVELPWAHHGMDANLAGPSGQITTFAIEHFLSAVTG